METTNKRLLSRREVASICGVKPASVGQWEKRGLLTPIRINRRVLRYEEADVSRLVKAGASETAIPATVEALA